MGLTINSQMAEILMLANKRVHFLPSTKGQESNC